MNENEEGAVWVDTNTKEIKPQSFIHGSAKNSVHTFAEAKMIAEQYKKKPIKEQ